MAYASQITIASGSSPNVAVPFPYLQKAHVHVSVNGMQTADNLLVWSSTSVIVLPSTPTVGASINVYRQTPGSGLLVLLADEALYDPTDINLALTQLLYVTQENYDTGQANAAELAAIVDTVNTAMASASESATSAAASAAAALVSKNAAAASATSAAASAASAAGFAGGGAPILAHYILGAAQTGATNSSVLTNGTFISWAITAGGSAVASLIDASITLAKLAASCFSDQTTAETGTDNTKLMTPLRVFQAIAAYLVANPQTYTPRTGSMRPTLQPAAETGWVLWADGTIGDASSSGSILASSTAQALFTLLFNSYSDTNCPLFTRTGSATTRAGQTDAVTAWAAHCRMSLPRGMGRHVGVSGAGSGLTSRAKGDFVGAETTTITVGNMPSHQHGIPAAFSPDGVDYGTYGPSGAYVAEADARNASPISPLTGAAGSGTAMSIMSPGVFIPWEIKL